MFRSIYRFIRWNTPLAALLAYRGVWPPEQKARGEAVKPLYPTHVSFAELNKARAEMGLLDGSDARQVDASGGMENYNSVAADPDSLAPDIPGFSDALKENSAEPIADALGLRDAGMWGVQPVISDTKGNIIKGSLD